MKSEKSWNRSVKATATKRESMKAPGLDCTFAQNSYSSTGGTLEIESAFGNWMSATLCFPVERSLRFPVGRAAGTAATL
jgi:hypothetical protein